MAGGGQQFLQVRLVDRGISGAQARLLPASVSTQVTLCPRKARQAPVVRPTYPVPMMQTFIRLSFPPVYPASLTEPEVSSQIEGHRSVCQPPRESDAPEISKK